MPERTNRKTGRCPDVKNKKPGGGTSSLRQYLFEQVAQYGFEQEIARKEDYRVTTEEIMRVMCKVRPSLTDKIIEEFEKDGAKYSRV